MSQTVTIEETIAATQTLTLKLNDTSSSNENPNPNPNNIESKSPVEATTDPKPEPDHAPIPIPDVGSEVIEAVKEFLKKQESSDEEVRAEATSELNSFIERENIAIETLLVLTKYAYDLNNADLLGVFCQRVADLIKDKKVEEIREIFKIENDFTPEEEQAIRDEHPWAFED